MLVLTGMLELFCFLGAWFLSTVLILKHDYFHAALLFIMVLMAIKLSNIYHALRNIKIIVYFKKDNRNSPPSSEKGESNND